MLFRHYVIKISIILSLLYILSTSQTIDLNSIFLFLSITMLCIIPHKVFLLLSIIIAVTYIFVNPLQLPLTLSALFLGISLSYMKISILSLVLFNIAYLLIIDYSTFNTFKWGFEHTKIYSYIGLDVVFMAVLSATLYSIHFMTTMVKYKYWVTKFMRYLAISLAILIGISLISWAAPWGSAIILFGLIAILYIEAMDRITKE